MVISQRRGRAKRHPQDASAGLRRRSNLAIRLDPAGKKMRNFADFLIAKSQAKQKEFVPTIDQDMASEWQMARSLTGLISQE